MRAAARRITIRYCAEAVVYHKVNGSTGGNEKPANAYYITRNWLLCNSLHMRDSKGVGGKLRLMLFAVYFSFNRFAWLMIWLFRGKRKMCTAMLKGISDYCKGKYGRNA